MLALAVLFSIIVAIISAFKRRRYWKHSLAISILSLIVLGITLRAVHACDPNSFCGLGPGILGAFTIVVLAAVSLILSFI